MLRDNAYKIISKQIFNSDKDLPKPIIDLLDTYKYSSDQIFSIFLKKLNEKENNSWILKRQTVFQKHAYLTDFNAGRPTAGLDPSWGIDYTNQKLESILFVNTINSSIITVAQNSTEHWQGKIVNSKLFRDITLNNILDNDFTSDYLNNLLFESYVECLLLNDFKMVAFNKLKSYYTEYLNGSKELTNTIKKTENRLLSHQEELKNTNEKLNNYERTVKMEEHYYSLGEKKVDFVTFLKSVKLINGYGSNIVGDLESSHNIEEYGFFDNIFNYYFTKDENGNYYYLLNGTAYLNGRFTILNKEEKSLKLPLKNIKVPVNNSLQELFSLIDKYIRQRKILLGNGIGPDSPLFWEYLNEPIYYGNRNYHCISINMHMYGYSKDFEDSKNDLNNCICFLSKIKEMSSYENLSNLINIDQRILDETIFKYLSENDIYTATYEIDPLPGDEGPAYEILNGKYGKNKIQFDSYYGSDSKIDYIRELSLWIQDIASYYIKIYEYILHYNKTCYELKNYPDYLYSQKQIRKLIKEDMSKLKKLKEQFLEKYNKQFLPYKKLIEYYNDFFKNVNHSMEEQPKDNSIFTKQLRFK